MTQPVTLGKGPLKIEVWPLGARLNRVIYKGIECVDGAADRDEARAAKKYNGAVVGPVANRIAGGTFRIDGTRYVLGDEPRQNPQRHGGPQGVHALDWKVAEVSKTTLKLTLGLADDLGGFPGNRVLTAQYEVGGHDFTLTLKATSDAPTLMNLALHPYWTLDAGGRDGLQICLKSNKYLPVDQRKIPTGEIADVEGTQFDLRELTHLSPEIDHNFCLEDAEDTVLTLQGKTLRMEMASSAPGCQIYSGKSTGIAIEPQHWPDAPHHPGFPSIELRPDETYCQVSSYRFSRL